MAYADVVIFLWLHQQIYKLSVTSYWPTKRQRVLVWIFVKPKLWWQVLETNRWTCWSALLSGHNHTGIEIHEYSSPFVGDRQGRSPVERRVRSGSMSKTMNTVRAYLIILQDMAQRIYFPDTERSRATILNVDTLVHMACCDLHIASINLPTP